MSDRSASTPLFTTDPSAGPGEAGSSATANTPYPGLTFLKLGGSLVTHKTREATPRPEVLQRLAAEVQAARHVRPELELLIGHGSGSFGHFAARRHGTREGVRTAEEWTGYAQVSRAAARLNRLVADTFSDAGIPILSLQPSASARCQDGELQSLALAAIHAALKNGLIPLLYGDVALDNVRGGTIISTEEIFRFLAPVLRPDRILLVGEAPGVLDTASETIDVIRPCQLDSIAAQLGASHGVDVTGGMLGKVTAMLELIATCPSLTVRILSGLPAGEVQRALVDPSYSTGTVLAA